MASRKVTYSPGTSARMKRNVTVPLSDVDLLCAGTAGRCWSNLKVQSLQVYLSLNRSRRTKDMYVHHVDTSHAGQRHVRRLAGSQSPCDIDLYPASEVLIRIGLGCSGSYILNEQEWESRLALQTQESGSR